MMMGSIFKHLEEVEASVMDLQVREDQVVGLLAKELANLRVKLDVHHYLL